MLKGSLYRMNVFQDFLVQLIHFIDSINDDTIKEGNEKAELKCTTLHYRYISSSFC